MLSWQYMEEECTFQKPWGDGLFLLWKWSWQHNWIPQRVWVEPQYSHCSSFSCVLCDYLRSVYLHLFCLCEVIQLHPLCLHLSHVYTSDLFRQQTVKFFQLSWSQVTVVTVHLIASHSSAVNISSPASPQTGLTALYISLLYFIFL